MTHTIRLEAHGVVVINGDPLRKKLTWKETIFVDLLMRSTGVVTRDLVLSALYKGQDEPEYNTIQVFLCNIRRKLGDHRDCIMTVRDGGWSWNRKYVPQTPPDNEIQVNIPSKYLDEICIIMRMDPQDAVLALVKQKYKEVLELT